MQNNTTSLREERDFFVAKIIAETSFAHALVFPSCSGDILILKKEIMVCQMKTKTNVFPSLRFQN